MRHFVQTLLCLTPVLFAGCNDNNSNESNNNNTVPTPAPVSAKFSMAVIGDQPYGTSPTDTVLFDANPAFISKINADTDVSMVLHAGDIHSGKQYCTLSYNLAVRDQYLKFKTPLIYTPGDNEWSDCHKAAQGGGVYNATTNAIDYKLDSTGQLIDYAGGDPVSNLDLVRNIFFPNPGKAFGSGMDVHSQALEYDTAFPTDKNYVENVWVEKSGVMMLTLNIPGGSNNDTDPWYGAPTMSPVQAQEVANRSAANLRWLDVAFKKAKANGDAAVVIMAQADMWDVDGKSPAHLTQYKQFLDRVASQSIAFGKPVLMINGDSHSYRSDNPLMQKAPCVIEPSAGVTATACSNDAYDSQPNGYSLSNFHRIVVHGSTAPLEWLKLTVDPVQNVSASANAFGPFTWTRMH